MGIWLKLRGSIKPSTHKCWAIRHLATRKEPKIFKASVIVSVYRDHAALQCIYEALTLQTEKNFELIISEDGESTEILNCVNNFGNQITVRHLTQEDIGFRKNRALNRATIAANSDYLIFIDGDCIPHPRFVEGHLREASKSKICAGRRVELGEGLSVRLKKEPKFVSALCTNFGMAGSLFMDSYVRAKNPEAGFYWPSLQVFMRGRELSLVGCNFSCSREALEKINGFNEDFQSPGLGEDSDIEWRFIRAGFSMKNVKFVTPLFHLYHPRNQWLDPKNIEIFESTKKGDIWKCFRGLNQANL